MPVALIDFKISTGANATDCCLKTTLFQQSSMLTHVLTQFVVADLDTVLDTRAGTSSGRDNGRRRCRHRLHSLRLRSDRGS